MDIIPFNTVFLSLDSALNEEIILNGGLKLYKAAEYEIEWNATVTGKVAGLPKKPKGECSEVVSRLKIGDEVAFSYRVVSDRCFPQAADYFMPMTADNPYQKKWTNSKAERLIVTAMPPVFGKFNKIWIGLLTDRRGNHIDGKQGNEAEVDEWLSHFKFSGVQDLAFNNMLHVGKEDFWRCPYTEILAKKDRKGRIVAVNDRIICEPIEEDWKHRLQLELATALPYQDIKIRYKDRGRIVSGGEDLGFRVGDIISFQEGYVEKYELWGINYLLIKKKRVQGRWL